MSARLISGVLAVVLALPLAIAISGGCMNPGFATGQCVTASVGNGFVDLGGAQTTGGSAGTSGTAGSSGSAGRPGSGGRATSSQPRATEEAKNRTPILRPQCSVRAMQTAPSVCDVLYGYQPPTAPSTQTAPRPSTSPRPATPAVTITDLASFRPHAPGISMQPQGWALVGLPTNFVAHAEAHIVTGSLFGAPAEVRFRPTGYHWNYGDGSTRRTEQPGLPWSQMRIPEFTDTATSHAYAAAGRYVVTLTVHYSPDYRLSGATWRPISGTIPVAAPELRLQVYEARTALVDAACGTASTTEGC